MDAPQKDPPLMIIGNDDNTRFTCKKTTTIK